MPTPIIETLTAAIETKLGELVPASLVSVNRPTLSGGYDLIDATAILHRGEPVADEPAPHRFSQWSVPFFIDAVIKPSSGATVIETRENQLYQDIVAKLWEDYTFGGVAIDGRADAPVAWDDNEGAYAGVRVVWHATIRHIEEDPSDDGSGA